MNIDECSTCIKRKTAYCPNSSKCLNTEDKPYYQNRIMLLEKNQQLKIQISAREEEYLKLKNQQKDFIKYLEDEIKRLEEVQVTSLEEITGKDYLNKIKKEILSKYEEIIGGVEYDRNK